MTCATIRSRALVAPLTVIAVVLLVTACGGGGNASNVAGTSTRTSNSSTNHSDGAPVAGTSTTSRALAYARCMRSHGAATFPDPDSSGQIPKAAVVSTEKANPSRFDSAENACGHLLPREHSAQTPAQIAQLRSQFFAFARCMRDHGVPNFPDPTSRSATDPRPEFNLHAAGLNPSSPQFKTTAEHCASQVHL